MAKPNIKWKSHIVYGADILEWLNKKLVIGICGADGYNLNYPIQLYNNTLQTEGGAYRNAIILNLNVQSGQSYSYGQGFLYNVRTYFHGVRPDTRIIGLVKHENTDGSLELELLGNAQINLSFFKSDRVDFRVVSRVDAIDDERLGVFQTLPTYYPTTDVGSDRCYMFATLNNRDNTILNPYDVNMEFDTEYSANYRSNDFIGWHCYQGQNVVAENTTLNITTDDSTTVYIGRQLPTRYQDFIKYQKVNMGLVDNCLNGDIYDMLLNTYLDTIVGFSGYKYGDLPDNRYQFLDMANIHVESIEYSQFYKFFNIPLTRSKADALKYIADGTLPSDVFLYPFDLKSLPATDGQLPNDDSEQNPPPSDENGDSGINGIPTTDAEPAITPNMLANNNLYWLQAGQLESFITWFWQHAGEIIELDDLWDRIKGLYNDLASAIVNIRFFPVDPYYIGGTTDTSDIIISSITMPISNIKILNRRKLIKRTLGTIDITHKYNAFTDYSPFTSIMLYLPFHGWIDIDIDLFVGNKLTVKCIYDHISGTIQYGIYVVNNGNEYLVNTVVAKMAVDVPITLQSKNDRDSAIFNNVTNAFGNLLGAGASVATGNPIGLVMGTAGIASSGTQSAPIKVNGTMGESGAYFMPNKCAIYIKRPSYNRPLNYAGRVGYPCNIGGILENFQGLTVVYNPQITFKGNKNADDITMKPMQSEVDEIYQLLEKGVII